MPPLNLFGTKKKTFPRAGAWAMVDGKLGVIFELKTVNQPVGDSDETVAIASASVHLVDGKGETTESITVPVSALSIASHDQIVALSRVHSLETPFHSAAMGYTITEAQLKSLTALQRKQIGKSFDDEDAAQALIEESQQHMLELQRQKIAKHPDAIALEAQIEEERVAFVQSVESRRQALFDSLSKTK